MEGHGATCNARRNEDCVKEESEEGVRFHEPAQRCLATHSKENKVKEGRSCTDQPYGHSSQFFRINRNTEGRKGGRKEKCRKGVPLTLLVPV